MPDEAFVANLAFEFTFARVRVEVAFVRAWVSECSVALLADKRLLFRVGVKVVLVTVQSGELFFARGAFVRIVFRM